MLWLPFVVHVMLFPIKQFGNFHISTFRSTCAVPNMAVLCSCLMSCFTGMHFRYLLSDSEIVPFYPIILVSLLSIHSTYTAFILQGLYILKSFRLPSSSHFYLRELQHLLACMFLFHYHGLWCPAYCHGWFYQFSLVNSIIWSPYFDSLFLLFLEYAHTIVPCLLFPNFLELLLLLLLLLYHYCVRAGAGHVCASHF